MAFHSPILAKTDAAPASLTARSLPFLNNPLNAMKTPLILVAVDFSIGSRSALEHAARLAVKQQARAEKLATAPQGFFGKKGLMA